jgi:hypothetical protein
MASTPSPDQYTQLQTQVSTTLAAADTAATQGVQSLSLVQQARLTQLTRTAASLTAKYGSSDPRTISAQTAVAATAATAARVAMLHQQLATAVPQVAADGWALYGHVFQPNAQGQPAPAVGFTVFLVDSQKTYQEDYGFAYTDSAGYFLISYAGSEPTATPATEAQPPTAGTQTSGESTGQTPAPAQNASPATPALYLAIVDTKAQPVYLSTTPFQPVTGAATYQHKILPGDQPLGDPPASIRKVAIPGN